MVCLGRRRAIVLILLNTDLKRIQLKTRLVMWTKVLRETEIKILANTFRAMPFESLNISLAKIASLNRNRSISIGKNQKDCFVVNDTKSVMNKALILCYLEF